MKKENKRVNVETLCPKDGLPMAYNPRKKQWFCDPDRCGYREDAIVVSDTK